MIYYVFFFTILLFAVLLDVFKTKQLNTYEKQIFVLLSFFLILMSGLRLKTGYDFESYKQIFESVKQSSWNSLFSSGWGLVVEPGYMILNYLCKWMPFQLYIFLISTVSVFIKVLFIYKISNNLIMCLFIYYSMYFCLYDMGVIRQGFAIGLLLWAFYYYIEGKRGKTAIYVMAPLMMGMAFCAEPIVHLVLTDKWLPCVPYLRIFCITYMFWPIHTANLNAINAMGRSDWFLRLEVIKKAVGMTILLSTMWFGVMAMACSLLVSNVLSQMINSWPNRKLLNYSYLDQVKDFAPGILLAVFMGVCVYFIGYIPLSTIVTLVIQIIAGATIFIALSAILKLEEFEYLTGMIKSFLKR